MAPYVKAASFLLLLKPVACLLATAGLDFQGTNPATAFQLQRASWGVTNGRGILTSENGSLCMLAFLLLPSTFYGQTKTFVGYRRGNKMNHSEGKIPN